jgi:hypothetical protein
MAENSSGGGTPFLAFLVGALLVVVVVIGFAVYGGGFATPPRQMDVHVNMPKPNLPGPPSTPNPAPLPAPTPKPIG